MHNKLEQYENGLWSANDALKLTNGKNEKGWYCRSVILSLTQLGTDVEWLYQNLDE